MSRKLPKLVQLGFHTCVGGCDGCLDLSNPDNKGMHTPKYLSRPGNVIKSFPLLIIVLAEIYVLTFFKHDSSAGECVFHCLSSPWSGFNSWP